MSFISGEGSLVTATRGTTYRDDSTYKPTTKGRVNAHEAGN